MQDCELRIISLFESEYEVGERRGSWKSEKYRHYTVRMWQRQARPALLTGIEGQNILSSSRPSFLK
jgi:hypothetical protein